MKNVLHISALLSSLCLIAACGGGGGGSGSGSGGSASVDAQTAPVISVVPQNAYKGSDGSVDTERVNAVQSTYQQQGVRQVGTDN